VSATIYANQKSFSSYMRVEKEDASQNIYLARRAIRNKAMGAIHNLLVRKANRQLFLKRKKAFHGRPKRIQAKFALILLNSKVVEFMAICNGPCPNLRPSLRSAKPETSVGNAHSFFCWLAAWRTLS